MLMYLMALAEGEQVRDNRLKKADFAEETAGAEGPATKGHPPLNTLLSSAFAASCFTSGAYIVGLSYFQTYMTGLKFNHGLYEKSATDYFVYATVALLEALPTWLRTISSSWQVVIAITSMALLFGAFQYFGNKIDESKWGRRQRERAARSSRLRAFGTVLAWPVGAGVVFFYIPVFIGFVLLMPILLGQSMGAKVAEREAKVHAKGCSTPPAGYFCTSTKNADGTISPGFIVDVSDSHIAIVIDGISKSVPREGTELQSQ
jgi:hypothetical protein